MFLAYAFSILLTILIIFFIGLIDGFDNIKFMDLTDVCICFGIFVLGPIGTVVVGYYLFNKAICRVIRGE